MCTVRIPNDFHQPDQRFRVGGFAAARTEYGDVKIIVDTLRRAHQPSRQRRVLRQGRPKGVYFPGAYMHATRWVAKNSLRSESVKTL